MSGDEPILIAALAPAFEVVIVEVPAFWTEPGNNGLVSEAVQKHLVNRLAEV